MAGVVACIWWGMWGGVDALVFLLAAYAVAAAATALAEEGPLVGLE